MATSGLTLRGMVASYREFASRRDGRTYRVITVFGDLVLDGVILCQVDGYDVFVDSPGYTRARWSSCPRVSSSSGIHLAARRSGCTLMRGCGDADTGGQAVGDGPPARDASPGAARWARYG